MKLKRIIATLLLSSLFLCGCADEKNDALSADTTVIADDNAAKEYSFEAGTGTFYYPDEIYNNYLTVEKEFDGTAQNVIDILYELENYKDNKVTVNSCYKQGNTLYIDFDNGFKNATGSTAQEYFVVYGTVKTLKSCFDVGFVRITVEGKDFNTPHGQYDIPL